MGAWPFAIAAIIAAPIIVYRVHHMLLRWESRGWIYYWHRKPKSGAMSCFCAVQQAIEPRYEHVARVRFEEPAESDLLIAKLLSCLQSESIDRAAIRELLATYRAGDRAELYAKAVRLASLGESVRAGSFPTFEAVAPD